MSEKMDVRVRFAPSPTGTLHIGGLRTALFNWLFARHNKGAFLLRIEDTDLERSKQEYTDAILGAFEWVGICSDEPLVIQSKRLQEHECLIQHLLTTGKAYKCFCTPEQVVARHEARYPGDAFVKYDGLCRVFISEKKNGAYNLADTAIAGSGEIGKSASDDRSYVVRFALPRDRHEITIEDLICGNITFHIDQLDDFIIARSDGRPMYNFVVVADDAYMRITHVIRAQEHIINTPKQILLYEAFNYKVPQFAHVPLILGPSGDKLSKRDGATSVLDYKKEGYVPDALLNYLARLGWAHGDQEIFSREELIAYFSLDHVGKKGAIFDKDKLQWVNAYYMRHMSAEDLYMYAIDCLAMPLSEQVRVLYSKNKQQLYTFIDLYKERLSTVKELMDMIVLVSNGPHVYDGHDIMSWITPKTVGYLQDLIKLYGTYDHFIIDTIKDGVKQIAQENGLKLVQLAQPIRTALQGTSSGPGVFELLMALGKEESIQRIQQLCNYLQKKAF